jgi:phosphoenolpyruvate-protein kinase (PTS system EI component)
MLISMAVDSGRAAKPKLKLGICGEHGGDPASIRFCSQVGLDYVSCSPFRLPVARLAAAQAAISTTKTGGRIVKANTKQRSAVRPGRAATRAGKTARAITKKRKARKKAKTRARAH